MKFRPSLLFVLIALMLPWSVAAQNPRYKLIDIPSLGGRAAYGNVEDKQSCPISPFLDLERRAGALSVTR
jgi:hypothetical protein